MVLTKTNKEELVERLKNLFENSGASIASNYSGVSATELTELRKNLKSKNINLVVTKNTLVKRVLADLNLQLDSEILDQPVIFAFGQDEAEVCKNIFEFSKSHENLKIVGGLINNEPSDTAKIKSLALLPGKKELQAKLVGVLTAPTYGLVSVLSGNIRNLVSVINQYKDKK